MGIPASLLVSIAMAWGTTSALPAAGAAPVVVVATEGQAGGAPASPATTSAAPRIMLAPASPPATAPARDNGAAISIAARDNAGGTRGARRPLYKSWVFWAIAGGLFTAAVVATIVEARPGPTPYGGTFGTVVVP